MFGFIDTWWGQLLIIAAGIAALSWLFALLWGAVGGAVFRSPIGRRRWANFRHNRRAWWALAIFSALFLTAMLADVVASSQPLWILKNCDLPFLSNPGCEILSPRSKVYTEADLGGDFPFVVRDYYDPAIRELLKEQGAVMISPLHPFGETTINLEVSPYPAPPSAVNPLGLDDTGRDVLARLIYGFRTSVLFAIVLTAFSAVLGVFAGAVQGYFGGWLDLIFQRIIEVWESIPYLFVVMIIAAIFVPTFWLLQGVLLLFTWTGLVGVVRAEFLRTRNFDYVRAARALGVGDWTIIFRHILPNALVATLTMLPFVLTGAIASLTSLDYLGLGLQDLGASLGELARQGQNNAQIAPWLAITAFAVLSVLMTLLIFIFEGVRDALDPRKVFA